MVLRDILGDLRATFLFEFVLIWLKNSFDVESYFKLARLSLKTLRKKPLKQAFLGLFLPCKVTSQRLPTGT